MLKHHRRYDYSPIVERNHFSWPHKKMLAVYIALNLEHFAFGEGLGAELAPGPRPQPDILNYSWRDYGNRVGIWYLLELFEELSLPVGLLVNAAAYEYCPKVIKAFRDRGDEIVAHGYTNSERQAEMNEQQEADLIERVTAMIRQHEHKSPTGWLGPWISQSLRTPDLLQINGYSYIMDWGHDDQPTWLKTQNGRILSLPHSDEINDIPAIIPNRTSASTFADMIIDQFDEMLKISQKFPLVMSISLHPYITGQPFRLKQIRRALMHIKNHAEKVWLTHPGSIADYFIAQNL